MAVPHTRSQVRRVQEQVPAEPLAPSRTTKVSPAPHGTPMPGEINFSRCRLTIARDVRRRNRPRTAGTGIWPSATGLVPRERSPGPTGQFAKIKFAKINRSALHPTLWFSIRASRESSIRLAMSITTHILNCPQARAAVWKRRGNRQVWMLIFKWAADSTPKFSHRRRMGPARRMILLNHHPVAAWPKTRRADGRVIRDAVSANTGVDSDREATPARALRQPGRTTARGLHRQGHRLLTIRRR